MFMKGGEMEKWIRWATFHCFQKNIKIILKSSTATATAYLQSEFFKLSLSICQTYKMIQNKSREEEGIPRYFAGVRFLYTIRKQMEGVSKENSKKM